MLLLWVSIIMLLLWVLCCFYGYYVYMYRNYKLLSCFIDASSDITQSITLSADEGFIIKNWTILAVVT